MTEENQEKWELPTNLEELYAKQIDFCRKIFDDCGEVQPMWVGQSEDGEIYPITSFFGSPEEKEATAMALKEIFNRYDVVRYVSMIESWMVVAYSKTYDPEVDARPSQHPDRIEVILIVGEDGETEIFGYFKIIREEGKKPTLSQFERRSGSGFGSLGTFSDLLPRKSAKKSISIH